MVFGFLLIDASFSYSQSNCCTNKDFGSEGATKFRDVVGKGKYVVSDCI